ncbi:hypothetical protein [Sphingobium sp. RAC03]|uniref:hypothetical protein n=1 Tax=Sphingobium sp. RAC03 TaxID=1843368 RepID=UPI000858A25E|nr:hypothetical protein [Sphingobium sp. RAC03]AOF97713.1 hypothetical protein BSY17_2673 [Sphingobium sp. RAC03]
MTIPRYTIGSAAAETLCHLDALHRADATPFRPVDLINIAGYSISEAHEMLPTDSIAARALIINAASRLIRAAEQLDVHVSARSPAVPHLVAAA